MEEQLSKSIQMENDSDLVQVREEISIVSNKAMNNSINNDWYDS